MADMLKFKFLTRSQQQFGISFLCDIKVQTMKKIILLLLPFFILTTAQAQRKKEFQIRGGLGWSIYSTEVEFTTYYAGLTFKNKSSDNAATVHLPLEFRYEISQRFNLGLDLKIGSYIYDPDSADGKSNHFVVIGIGAEYNFINKDNFRWYGGVGFNTCLLELENDYEVLGVPVAQVDDYKGGGAKINTGILWFFASHIGLNFNLGFDSHNFTLDTHKINGQEQDLSNIDGKLTVKGVDGTLGLVLRF